MKVKSFSKILGLSILALSCTSLVHTAQAAEQKYVLISHAPDSDSWWNTIKNATKDASKDFGVRVDYRNPSGGDLADMARLIEQSAAANYSGVVTTIADFNVLKNSIKKVTDKGIALVSINSGTKDQSQELGAIMHIGQPEYDAGKAAGEQAKAKGIKSFLCVNHYATNPASFERCRGFADAIGADMRKSTIDSGQDPTEVASKVTAYLRQHPDTQAVLALGPLSADPTIAALKKTGKAGKIFMATFDLSTAVSEGIKDGTVNFAVDQQPYVQGYLGIAVAVEANKLKTKDPAKIIDAIKTNNTIQNRLREYGLVPVYNDNGINSGPGFINKDNIDLVAKYAGRYR